MRAVVENVLELFPAGTREIERSPLRMVNSISVGEKLCYHSSSICAVIGIVQCAESECHVGWHDELVCLMTTR